MKMRQVWSNRLSTPSGAIHCRRLDTTMMASRRAGGNTRKLARSRCGAIAMTISIRQADDAVTGKPATAAQSGRRVAAASHEVIDPEPQAELSQPQDQFF